MFFRFISQEMRHDIHRKLYERGIHCLKYPERVLAVCVPDIYPNCNDCQQVVHEGEEECPFESDE